VKLLSASYVLPIASDPIPEGAVLIEDAIVREVGPASRLRKKYPEAKEEPHNNAALLPGLVNCDTALEFPPLDGTGREPNFIDWFLARLECRQQIRPEERRAHITQGLRRLLSSGTTCVGDVGDYAGSLPTFGDSPLRLTLFAEILTSAEASVQDRYQAALAIVEELRKSERLQAGLAPYSAYTLSRNLLKVIASQAGQMKIPLKIHAAESFAEMQFFYESSGEIAERLFPKLGWVESLPPPHRKTPIQFLEAIGLLEGSPILIGCLHLADGDLDLLTKRRCRVVWLPRLQKHLKLGEFPVKKLKGVPIGLGTDGSTLSLWDEMREALPRCNAKELLRMATLEGAQVLGRGDEIGSLEAGKKADLIAVKIPPSLKPAQICNHLVEKTTEREILSVWINGKKI